MATEKLEPSNQGKTAKAIRELIKKMSIELDLSEIQIATWINEYLRWEYMGVLN